MDENLIKKISSVRDLGSKYQNQVEDSVEHELGIHLKRDAACDALDYFLRDQEEPLLQKSLAKYLDFTIFFIDVQLKKTTEDISRLLKPYRKYKEQVSETIPAFSTIVKAHEKIGDHEVNLKTLEVKDFDASNDEQTEKDIGELNKVDTFMQHLLTCKNLYDDNRKEIKKAARNAKWQSILEPKKIFTTFILPILIGLLIAYLVYYFGLRGNQSG